MKNKALYITVRLDIEYDEHDMTWNFAKEEIISNMNYNFKYDFPKKHQHLKITDTEICGENEII